MTGVLFMITNNLIMDNIFTTILSFPQERNLLHREYKNGTYSLFSWFWAFVTCTIGIQLIYASALVLPVIVMVGLNPAWDRVIVMLLCAFLVAIIGAMIGVTLGATSQGLKQAQGKVLPAIVPMLLFSGYVIPYADIPAVFRPIYYISIFQYAFTILRINQFHGLEFTDGTTGDEYLALVNCSVDDHSVPAMFGILAAYALTTTLLAYYIVRFKARQKTG
jgi:hypothetical protein